MAPHSSTLAWKIPWTEEPGRLQSMGSLRVGHDWATSLSLFTFHFHALEKEMATHSSVLAWRIPGMGEPGGLLSMGSHRVGHDWSDLVAAAAVFFYVWKKCRSLGSLKLFLWCAPQLPGANILCVCVWQGVVFQEVSAVGWWLDECNIFCWLIWQRHFSSIILIPSEYSKNQTLPLVAHNSVLQDHRSLNFPRSYFILFLYSTCMYINDFSGLMLEMDQVLNSFSNYLQNAY